MPLPELPGIDDALNGRDGQSIRRRHLATVILLIRTIVVRGDSRLDGLDAAAASAGTRLTALEAAAASAGARLDALEAKTPVLLTVVATAGALPATANVRQWFRVQGDPAVYIGNGAGQPLTKLVPA